MIRRRRLVAVADVSRAAALLAVLLPLVSCKNAAPDRPLFERFLAQDPVAEAVEDPGGDLASDDEPGEEREPYNKMAFALGSISAPNRENGVRLGLEYERLWNPDWGLFDQRVGFGLMFDVDTPPVDLYLLAFQMVYRPLPPVKILIAPGYRILPDHHDEWMVRTGMSYEFELGKLWYLGPEFFVDLVQGDEVEGIIAIALTKEC